MISAQIHQALSQVKELQQAILDKQRFKGYSGRARAISGSLALLAAFVMSSSRFPQTENAHISGWGLVFLLGLLLNFGVLVHWFLFNPGVKRDIRKLKPTIDAFPSFFVGGVLTIVMIYNNQYHFLFGTWMCLFGLANLSSRHVLPRKIWAVGLFYILCGTVFLLLPHISIQNPWPVGIVFFIGEWAGGIVLHFDNASDISIRNILGDFLKMKEIPNVNQIR